MNNTYLHHHLWPYALRGSVTLIVENTTIEIFEQTIYRNLRSSIARVVRSFCSTSRQICLSHDTDAVRAEHVIIQSYEEQLDDRRLYVAVFIKDPYRQDIALTNDQFLLALKRNRQQLYQDIKHRINLPSTFFEQTSLDPLWLYGVCLLALLVLVVVILMLIMILAKRTVKSTKSNETLPRSQSQIRNARGKSPFISSPIQATLGQGEEDLTHSPSNSSRTDSSQTSDSIIMTNLSSLPPLPPLSSSSYFQHSSPRTSYFHSAIETAIKQHLHDDEPIPFIDDNVSVTNSRKSSACWSDRTSLSSRLGLAWKLNFIRSGTQMRASTEAEATRRFNYRTVRYTIPTSKQFQFHEEL